MPQPSPSTFAPFVHSLQRRSVLDADEAQALADLPGRIEQLPANVDFVALGENVQSATFVVAGLIGRFGQTREGRRQITALHVPGDVADLHSVVLPRASSALQALTATTVVRIPHHALRKVAARFPAVAEAFWRHCGVDSRIATEWVVNLGRRSAMERVAHLICEMASRLRLGRNDPQFSIDFPVTQYHLGDIAGLSAVHVNRVLQALKAQKLLRYARGRVDILDWDALIELCDFDAAYLQNDIAPVRLAAF